MMIEFLAGAVLGVGLYIGGRYMFDRLDVRHASLSAVKYYTVPPQGGPYGADTVQGEDEWGDEWADYQMGELGLPITHPSYEAHRQALADRLSERRGSRLAP